MKVVVCVELTKCVVDCIKAFPNMEMAMKYFNSIVPNDGSWYDVYVSETYAYAVSNPESDYEIDISEVEMEAE